ncbi:MAG: hypothetical protein U9O83_03625 [Campylobacterota bacterium]|nr:hypothetical protein [Campylobacterota bacterium]
MLKVVLFLVLFIKLLLADFEYTLDNTNFTISQGSVAPNIDKTYLYNYDRLRFRGDYREEDFFATVIGDGVNYLGHDYVSSNDFKYLKLIESDTPFKTQTSFHDYYEGSIYAKLYRLYGGYEDNNNRVVLGLQNISMGVGRIWTPTNLFNPKNIYALEPDETFGVAALSYTRHIDDTSHISVVASQKADHSFKYGARYKAFLDFADFAIDAVSSDDTKMLGLELEGNLLDSGVELRSEGAYIKSTFKSLTQSEYKEFFQGIVGADYGFVNGVTLVAEALYSSESFSYQEIVLNYDSEILSNLLYSNFYTALSLTYAFNIFLDGSLLYIESFNDENSRFVSPSLTYTLNDYNSFVIGAMMQNGSSNSEFGMFENTYYLKWALSF